MKPFEEWGLVRWLASRQWGAIAVTIAILAVVVVRSIWPELLKLDAISVALIVLALIPWMRSIVSSIELAGVGKVDLRDVEQVAATVDAADLPHQLDAPANAQLPAVAEESAGHTRIADADAELVRQYGELSDHSDYESPYTLFKSHISERNLASGKLGLWGEIKSELPNIGYSSYARAALLMEITVRLRMLATLHGGDPGLPVKRQLKWLEAAGVLTADQARAVNLARTMLTAMLNGTSSPVTELRAEQVAQEVSSSLSYLIRKRQGESS